MKKIINYVLFIALMVTFLPYNTLAQTTNVGVTIKGSATIDVVTTISADITLDLATGETTPTYMEIKNNSTVPVDVKITDISTPSEGAPSTFVKATDKDWDSLSIDDTKTYVNFNILGEGQNVTEEDILRNKEIDLGTLDAYSTVETNPYIQRIDVPINSFEKVFEIKANFGKNWIDGDKNFSYQITTVYAQAEEYTEPELSYTYPAIEPLTSITDFKVVCIKNSEQEEQLGYSNIEIDHTKTYISLGYKFIWSEDISLNYNDIFSNSLIVNNEEAVYVGQGGAKGTTGYEVGDAVFSINKLDSSTKYIKMTLTLQDQVYTQFAKLSITE